MVRINLLKGSHKKSRGKSAGVSSKAFAGIGIFVLIAAVGVALYTYRDSFVKKPAPAPVAHHEEPPKNDYKPTTLSNPSMLEDVVKEVSDERERVVRSGVLEIAYDDMSFSEKANYEVLFLKNVIEMLSRVVPVGIGFKSLECENFQTVYAEGLGKNKAMISSMFSGLKNEKVTLLEPPYSYIKANGENGFKFVVSCIAKYGLNLTDPFQAIDHFGTADDIPLVIKKIMTIARDEKVVIANKPNQTQAQKIGPFKRYTFHLQGSSSYNEFAKFVNALYNQRVPVAFKKVSVVANPTQKVDISADFILTVRE